MPVSISAVLAIKDEADMLEDCLKSLAFADDIIVIVDSRTTDTSADIAKAHHARVFEKDFEGFASQKNYGFDQSTSDWILLIDADERCTADLQSEIKRIIQTDSETVAYNIPFRSVLLGREMKYGGWDETHIRLFKNGKARYSAKEIHEELVIDGHVGQLGQHIIHISHRSIGHILDKADRYTSLDAQHLFDTQAPPVSRWDIMYVPLKFFIFYYLRKQGFRDGIEGLIEVLLSRTYYQFLTYAKLWELQRTRVQ